MRLLRPDTGEVDVADDEVVVAVTRAELALFASALNEALEAVEEWEFDTRLGVPPEHARALRSSLQKLLWECCDPE